MKFDRAQKLSEVNQFELKDDRDYSWILDYAKYRFSHTSSSMRRAEEKAEGLLKLILTTAGGGWLVFLFAVKELNAVPKDCLNYWLVAGFAILAISGICGLMAIFPRGYLSLVRESAAMNFVNEKEGSSKKPIGRFALSLMICNDFREKVTSAKGRWVAAGFASLMVAVACLTIGFSSLLLSQTKTQSRSLRAGSVAPWHRGPSAGLTSRHPAGPPEWKPRG